MADRRKKRRRPALACVPCRTRKVKCDRNRPCDQCSRTTIVPECYYDGDYDEDTTGPSLPAIRSSSPQPERRHVNGFGERYGETAHGLLQPSSHGEAASQAEVQAQMTRLQCSVELLQRQMHDVQSQLAHAGQNGAVASPRHGSTGQPKRTDLAPRMRIGTDKVKFWGPGHYVYAFESSHLYQQIKNKDARQYPDDPDIKDVIALIEQSRSLRKRIKAASAVPPFDPNGELSRALPRRKVCDELCHNYLRTFERIYRILHVPTFDRGYRRLWDEPHTTPASFSMTVRLVLAIGASFYKSDRNERTALLRQAPMWLYEAQWWLDGPTEKSTFTHEGLQVHCLLVVARQVLSVGSAESILTCAGSCLRRAMAMGLHRDPTNFVGLSDFHIMLRRRLWATVLELVVQTSMDANVAPIISASDYDTLGPQNSTDEDIDDPNHPDDVSHGIVDCVILTTLHGSIGLRLELVRSLNASHLHSSSLVFDEAESELVTALHTIYHKLNTAAARSGETYDFHRRLLSVLFARYRLFLGRIRALRQDARVTRNAVSSAAKAASDILAQLPVLQRPLPEMTDFDLLYTTSRGTFAGALSLDAIMTLSQHLMSQWEPATANMLPMVPVPRTVDLDPPPSTVLRLLEEARVQHRNLIDLGASSTKAFITTAAMLGSLKALQRGQPPGQGLKSAIKEAVQDAKALLTLQIGRNESRQLRHGVNDSIGLDEDVSYTDSNDWFQGGDLDPDPSWLLSLWNGDFSVQI